MANENKGFTFLPKTADAIFEYQGEVAFVAKANTSAAVTISQTKTEKRGGQDNVLIGTIFSDKTIEVSITAASWMPEFLAAEVGSPIKIGGYEFISNDLNIVATEKSSDIVVELPAVPVDKVIHLKRADGTYVKVPATGTTVSIKEFGFNKGDCVSALGLFDYTGKRIDLSTSTSPMVGKLTLTSPIFRVLLARSASLSMCSPSSSLMVTLLILILLMLHMNLRVILWLLIPVIVEAAILTATIRSIWKMKHCLHLTLQLLLLLLLSN